MLALDYYQYVKKSLIYRLIVAGKMFQACLPQVDYRLQAARVLRFTKPDCWIQILNFLLCFLWLLCVFCVITVSQSFTKIMHTKLHKEIFY